MSIHDRSTPVTTVWPPLQLGAASAACCLTAACLHMLKQNMTRQRCCAGSTARGGAAAGPPTLEACSTPLPPVAELPPINTSPEEGMGSSAAAAAAPQLMTGMVSEEGLGASRRAELCIGTQRQRWLVHMPAHVCRPVYRHPAQGKLHISTDSGADGASPEGSIVDGASPMSLAAGADFADQVCNACTRVCWQAFACISTAFSWEMRLSSWPRAPYKQLCSLPISIGHVLRSWRT